MEIRYLPDDVVLEILPRLPVKTLLRFKCVAKSWNSFISSQEFSKSHLRYSNLQDKIILLRDHNGVFYKQFSLVFYKQFSLHGHPFLTELPMMVSQEYEVICCLGSCDGLVCFRARKLSSATVGDIYLWNPSTRKTKCLPGFGYESGYESGEFNYTFGYDESCDDYKVVALFGSSCRDKSDGLVKIFSLRTGELKRIKHTYGRWILETKANSFVNGKIHWLTKTIMEGGFYIAYLDLTTEKCGILDKPDFVELPLRPLIKTKSRGSLYVVYSSISTSFVYNVWLVKPGYGNGKTTWTKVHNFRGFEAYGRYQDSLLVHNTVGFLIHKKRKTGIFNPSDPSVKYHELGSSKYSHTGIAYVESLVSPSMS